MDHLSDPDHLCAFASAIHEVCPEASRNSAENTTDIRSEILDALARLIVYQPASRDQVVALGATLDFRGHIELYVAGDPELPPKVVIHLNKICTSLVDIRAIITASPNRAAILDAIAEDPGVRNRDATEPALLSLRKLHHELYEYSIERIRARLEKHYWTDTLQHLAACISGAPASTRQDLSQGERKALRDLQSSSRVHGHFPKLNSFVEGIMECVKAGSQLDFRRLSMTSMAIVVVARKLKSDMADFDRFVYAYTERRMAPEVPRKRPNMSRWLNKFTFVATDYRSLVKILTRPFLSLLFGDRVLIHPLHDTFKSKSYVTKLTAENIESTLTAFGYNEGNFEQLDQFVGEVERASKRTQATAQAKRVHCECALLCYLGQLGRPMLPYIGVSKLSCAFCDLYFAAYREQMQVEIYTHGTHGQTTAWMCPDFPDNAAVKDDFRKKLRAYIDIRIADEMQRRNDADDREELEELMDDTTTEYRRSIAR